MINISDTLKNKWKQNERYIQNQVILSYYQNASTKKEVELTLYTIDIEELIDVSTSSIPSNQMTLKVDNESGIFDEFSSNSILNYLQNDATINVYITLDEDFNNKILLCSMDFENVKTNEDLTATITCSSSFANLQKIPFRDIFNAKNTYGELRSDNKSLFYYLEDNYNEIKNFDFENVDNNTITKIDLTKNYYSTLYDVIWNIIANTTNGFIVNDRNNYVKMVSRRGNIVETIPKDLQLEKAKITKENEFNKVIINNSTSDIATNIIDNVWDGTYLQVGIVGNNQNQLQSSTSMRTAEIKVKPNTKYSIQKISNTGTGTRFRYGMSNAKLNVNDYFESGNYRDLGNNTTQITLTTNSNTNYLYLYVTDDTTNIPYLNVIEGETFYNEYINNYKYNQEDFNYEYEGTLINERLNQKQKYKNLLMTPYTNDNKLTLTATKNDYHITTDYFAHLEAGKTYKFSCKTDGIISQDNTIDSVEFFLLINKAYTTMRNITHNDFYFDVDATGDYYLRVDVNKNGATHSFWGFTIEEARENINLLVTPYHKDYKYTMTATRDDYYVITDYYAHLEAGKTYKIHFDTDGIGGYDYATDTVETWLLLNKGYNWARSFIHKDTLFSPNVTGDFYLRLDVNKNGATHSFWGFRIVEVDYVDDDTQYLYKRNVMGNVITSDKFDLSSIVASDFKCTNCTIENVVKSQRYVYYTITGNENANVKITLNKSLPLLTTTKIDELKIGTNSDNNIEINNINNILSYNYYEDITTIFPISLKVKTKIMGLPYLELGDVVAIETDYGEKIVNITKLNYSYDGGLVCDLEGYSTDYDGLFPSNNLYPSDTLYPNMRK